MKPKHIIIGSALAITAMVTMFYIYQKNKSVDLDIEWDIVSNNEPPLSDDSVPVFSDGGVQLDNQFVVPNDTSIENNYYNEYLYY